ncbi:hypothetical protein LCGC14_2137460, partial [marine sediment metagenome]
LIYIKNKEEFYYEKADFIYSADIFIKWMF